MIIKDVIEQDKVEFNKTVSHPLQSFEWGEFRKKTGITVIRKGFIEQNELVSGLQLTIHKVPHTPWNIGYLPKAELPTIEVIAELKKIGKANKCIFIQLEPNAISKENALLQLESLKVKPSVHPLFTKYTFMLDLTKSEDELLKNMHPKTRYNIKVAQKKEVTAQEDNSDAAFEEYLKLTKETTSRQGFYAHTQKYHRQMWETLRKRGSENSEIANNELTAHLFTARYEKKILTTWILFVFHDTLYYPYGASSSEHRETMSSNLVMWEAIKFGKKLGLKKFDMWGGLGPNPDKQDPWYGFHRFKEGYGPTLTEFVGSYDLVINPALYQGFKLADKARWMMLRSKNLFR